MVYAFLLALVHILCLDYTAIFLINNSKNNIWSYDYKTLYYVISNFLLLPL
jgi:hypothetical protein